MHVSLRTTAIVLVGLALGCSQGAGSSGGTSPRAGSYAGDATQNDERGFTERFVADVAQRFPSGGCVYGGPRTVACGDMEISLDRMWNYCIDNGGDCDAMVAEFADGMVSALRENLSAATATREQLRLAVRTGDYGETVARVTEGAVVRPAFGDLVAIVMVDSPSTARSYGSADAEALGLDADTAYEVALANTLAELGDLPGDGSLACGSAVAVMNRYYYESSRLLDPRLFGGATTNTRAPMLVAVPAYDAILLTLDCGAESRLALAAIAAQVAGDSSMPLSTTLFRVTAEGIAPITP